MSKLPEGMWPTPTSDMSLRNNRYQQGGQSLGNAVVPQVVELIGRRLYEEALDSPMAGARMRA